MNSQRGDGSVGKCCRCRRRRCCRHSDETIRGGRFVVLDIYQQLISVLGKDSSCYETPSKTIETQCREEQAS